MYFVLTFVGLCAIGYLLWRAFGPVPDEDHAPRQKVAAPPQRRTPPPIGPDDDPEFLSELDRRGRDDDSI